MLKEREFTTGGGPQIWAASVYNHPGGDELRPEFMQKRLLIGVKNLRNFQIVGNELSDGIIGNNFLPIKLTEFFGSDIVNWIPVQVINEFFIMFTEPLYFPGKFTSKHPKIPIVSSYFTVKRIQPIRFDG